MYKILIVEDDEIISKTLKQHLNTWGYEAKCVTDFEHVSDEVETENPHLVLLDITLPYFNGFYWCGEIRKVSKVPIIFLSSASDNMNIVMAMNMGGDDFVAKPFDLTVLTAKISALCRRSYDFIGKVNLLEHNGVTLNLNDATLCYNQKKISLTKNDFKILQILMENAGKVISRESIMERLWESDSFIDDNTLTVSVARLRKKLDEIDLSDFIVTKKKIGYVIL